MAERIWSVAVGSELHAEWVDLPRDVQDEILAHGRLLERYGPNLNRPHVDTLKGSKYPNMKGASIQRGRRRLACSVRIRPTARRYPAGSRRQVWNE